MWMAWMAWIGGNSESGSEWDQNQRQEGCGKGRIQGTSFRQHIHDPSHRLSPGDPESEAREGTREPGTRDGSCSVQHTGTADGRWRNGDERDQGHGVGVGPSWKREFSGIWIGM